MTQTRLLLEAFGFTLLSLLVVGGLGLVGLRVAGELAGLSDTRPLLVFVAASPVALLGGYRWFKHRLVRPGVA